MDGMSVMAGISDVVEDAIGEEDAEGEDEWDEMAQQQQPYQEVDGHVHVNDDRDGDSFEDIESEESEEDEDDDDFVLKHRKPSLSDSGRAPQGRNLRPRSRSSRYSPYTDSITKPNNRRRSQPGLNSSTSSLPVPIPVPNLTKKSRGRRVPTLSSLEDIRSAASGAGKKRQSVGGKNARMYLCGVDGCGKCFARGEHLKRHVRSIHTYEKREGFPLLLKRIYLAFFVRIAHKCPYIGCGKHFSRYDNLIQHLRVHKDYVPPRSRSSSSMSSPPLLT